MTSALLHGSLSSQRGGLGAGCGGGPTSVPVTPSGAEVQPWAERMSVGAGGQVALLGGMSVSGSLCSYLCLAAGKASGG